MPISLMQKDEGSVFQYGFLSSRTSEALKEYLDKGIISDKLEEVLKDAGQLLEDILSAQKLIAKDVQSVAPSETALEAFSHALEVIANNKTDFDVKDMGALTKLFDTIHGTIEQLVQGSTQGRPSRRDVEKTRMFFTRLSKLMLAQLSIPREEKPSRA